MIKKVFTEPFYSLPRSSVTCHKEPFLGSSMKTHKSGWTITGSIDPETNWLEHFEATHQIFGRVRGFFITEIEADSDAGLTHFLLHHPPVVKVTKLEAQQRGLLPGIY